MEWSVYKVICSRDTLVKLEIDHSSRVSDSVVPDLLKLHNLKLLSMAGSYVYVWIGLNWIGILMTYHTSNIFHQLLSREC